MPLIRKLHPAPQFNNNEFIFSMLTHGVLLILIVVDCIDSDCVWWFHLSWKLACVWCVFFLLLVIDDLLPNRELQTNSNSKKKGTEILQIWQKCLYICPFIFLVLHWGGWYGPATHGTTIQGGTKICHLNRASVAFVYSRKSLFRPTFGHRRAYFFWSTLTWAVYKVIFNIWIQLGLMSLRCDNLSIWADALDN